MAKKKPPKKRPATKPSLLQRGWVWLAEAAHGVTIGSLVGVAGLVIAYFNTLPAVDYSLILAKPLGANQLLTVRGATKNYGTTVARDFEAEYWTAIALFNERIRPDFIDHLDHFGHRKPPITPFDLAPGEEMSNRTDGMWDRFINESEYLDLMSGKRRLLVFSQISYKDLLSLSRTKYDCRTYVPGQAGLVKCSIEDWISPYQPDDTIGIAPVGYL